MFAKRHRFHGPSIFRWVYAGGTPVRGRTISLRFREQAGQPTRIAVVVSRKVHKSAVVRNRIRRRVYEAVRAQLGNDPIGYAIACTVYNDSVADMPTADLAEEITNLLSKAHILSGKPGGRAIVE